MVEVSGVAQAAPSPNLAGIAHVALRVHDLAASVAFYERLGFVKAFELSRDGKVYEAFLKINDRQFIELYPVDAKNTQVGFLHLCFEGKDLQAAHDYYLREGLKPGEVKKAGAGNLLFTMAGPLTPTGPQNLEYTQYMPGSLHSKDFGQHLGAERVATKLTEVTVAANDPAAARSLYVEKLAFGPEPGDRMLMELPGAPEDRVQIAPAAPLGFKARVGMQADDLKRSAALLRTFGVPYTEEAVEGHPALTVLDPDGNQIVVWGAPLLVHLPD